ncbi:hypothetical protein S7S_11135 [Isoalcanivorax pacificus W11-5]|uniref:Uncharacterized protein n=1 Tax=Isoalcanivorax pacificus W11-5 TaxID=391936 RepID=A0A0B4XK33_9GAMM|nr:hypothetical protein [Isoalcanivorax pacificus]AJD48639.1 hypothetical protein S7S_11135 [Isoalcanivorax pacificus W11-5]
MSLRLHVLIQCPDDNSARMLADYLLEDTRPLLDDDVEPGYEALYSSIEELAYPDEVEADGTQVMACWDGNDEIQFSSLRPLLKIDGFTLVLGYEFPDYADHEDGGYFWIYKDGRFVDLPQRTPPSGLDKDTVERVFKGLWRV